MASERLAQRLAARVAAAQDVIDGVELEPAMEIGLRQRTPQPTRWRARGKVQQRSGDRGHGQPSMPDPIESPRVVELDAPGRVAAMGHADVDRRRFLFHQPPPPRRGGVAERRSGTGEEECRCESALDGYRTMTDCVYAAMEPVQATLCDPSGDHGAADAAGVQLTEVDHSPL